MRVMFCGGGTAGHITPALAIAEEIKRTDPRSSIIFVGRDGGRENQMIIREGYILKTIKMQGLRRSLSTENIKSLIYTLKALKKAKELILEFNPDVVVGTGGYVCLPVLLAARQLGIKTALHESNVTPGLTTRFLSKKVDLLLLGQENSEKHFGKVKNCQTVGTPIRKEFLNIDRAKARKNMGLGEKDVFILSFGGSLGAEKMNQVVIEVMRDYSAKDQNVIHVHGCGDRYYEDLKKRCHINEESKCKVLPFISDLPKMMMAADIVICRCGAATLAEISQAGLASILIPSPNVTGNHQYKNGMHFKEKNAAYLIEEEKLSAEGLKKAIIQLRNSKNDRKSMAENVKQLSKPNSAKTIANELKKLVFEV